MPEMSPQRDRGHKREKGEAEKHGDGYFGPARRLAPVRTIARPGTKKVNPSASRTRGGPDQPP